MEKLVRGKSARWGTCKFYIDEDFSEIGSGKNSFLKKFPRVGDGKARSGEICTAGDVRIIH